MIDINQPVTPGDDLVINEGGDQHLGNYAEFDAKAAKGELTGVHYDAPVEGANPGVDVTVGTEDEPREPVAEPVKRSHRKKVTIDESSDEPSPDVSE